MDNLKKYILFVSILAGFIPVLFFFEEYYMLSFYVNIGFVLSFSIANGLIMYFVVCKILNLLLKNRENIRVFLLPLSVCVVPLVLWFLFVFFFASDSISQHILDEYNLYEFYNFLFVGVGLLTVALSYGSIFSISKRIKKIDEGTADIEEYSTKTLVNKVGAWIFVSSAIYFINAITQTSSGEESIGLIFLYPLVFMLFLFSLPFLIYLIRRRFVKELMVLLTFQVGLFIFLSYIAPSIHSMLNEKSRELYEQSLEYQEFRSLYYRDEVNTK